MIRIDVIQSAEPTQNQREQFKQYASVPDNSRDALLEGCLKRAMLEVQSYSDKALLDCTFELTATDVRKGDSIKLYRGGSVVESVKNGKGEDIGFRQEDGLIVLDQAAKTVVVRYRNTVKGSELERLQPVVWQYAVGLYDGEDPRTLANILKQTYAC